MTIWAIKEHVCVCVHVTRIKYMATHMDVRSLSLSLSPSLW
jgi:hypothetical protein